MIGLKTKVKIDRPHRYAKQLASHFQKAGESSWETESKSGHTCFENPEREAHGRVDYRSDEQFLYFCVQASSLEAAQKIAQVISVHLLRFASSQNLDFGWVLTDVALEGNQNYEDFGAGEPGGQEVEHFRSR